MMFERFWQAVVENHAASGSRPELLPRILARACAQAVPVLGAGLSVTHQLRVPLGASDEVAARAERLQSTLGVGPCLSATRVAHPLTFDLASMAELWPVFHAELVGQTPFRSIASFPLKPPGTAWRGALDLYSTDPTGPQIGSLAEVEEAISRPMAVMLSGAWSSMRDSEDVPAWLTVPPAAPRLNVWVAVGMLMEHAHLGDSDALASLRAYAFGHNLTLEDTANQLTSLRLLPPAVI